MNRLNEKLNNLRAIQERDVHGWLKQKSDDCIKNLNDLLERVKAKTLPPLSQDQQEKRIYLLNKLSSMMKGFNQIHDSIFKANDDQVSHHVQLVDRLTELERVLDDFYEDEEDIILIKDEYKQRSQAVFRCLMEMKNK